MVLRYVDRERPKRRKAKRDYSVRPYRIRDSTSSPGRDVLYHYYVHVRSAHIGVLSHLKWMSVGTVLEVWNINTGQLLGQYKRGTSSIMFMR